MYLSLIAAFIMLLQLLSMLKIFHLSTYQNLTCCARCKIKKLHLENNELQRQLFNNTALNLKYDRFSKCKKKKEKEDFIFQFCLMFY